jgi:hypothetical protein
MMSLNVHAQAVACVTDDRFDQLNSTAQTSFDQSKAQFDEILNCQTQKKFWNGSSCVDAPTPTAPPACTVIQNIVNTSTFTVANAVVQRFSYNSPVVEASRCHQFFNNGRSRNLSEIKRISTCINQGYKVQVAGQYVNIYADSCVPNPTMQLIWSGPSRACPECFTLPSC